MCIACTRKSYHVKNMAGQCHRGQHEDCVMYRFSDLAYMIVPPLVIYTSTTLGVKRERLKHVRVIHGLI